MAAWQTDSALKGERTLSQHNTTDERDNSLAAQYESYPYPERNPLDERKRLLIGSPSHLREIDYWVFKARRPRTTPLNVLIAGCGTGDAAIMLATHMTRADRSGEVLCLDRSDKALSVAKARAAERKLTNIRFIQASIDQIPSLNLGLFDYIDCCGVLHHLPDPEAALQILNNSLAADGGMGLMVYAPYGRTGVYMLQDALHQLAPVSDTPKTRLDIARRVMRYLPATAWLRQNGNFGDHLSGGDAGLYDLLLNPRDRAYTAPRFLDLIDNAGLKTACLLEPARYNPSLFLPDAKLRTVISSLSFREQAALAESLAGNMATHVAYVVKNTNPTLPPDFMARDSVPVMREIPGTELAMQMTPDHILPFSFGTLVVPIALPPQARGILPLIDGVRSVGDIAQILATRGVPDTKFETVWRETFSVLESLNRVLLQAPS
ncbi:class I SAM-dependent methyltransferase [Acetobacter thailandicus]|nr:class I SAM-dependent methyltransferase [Acetobacter thailandicus]MBS0959624.1 class I SAM-dependent methyltransferase [Acetobacter thailandicus]